MEREKALNQIRAIYKNLAEEDKEALASLVPELKESEDERIRKNCIHFLELQRAHHASTFEIDDCIAYLERQQEQPITTNDLDEEIHRFFDDCIVVNEAKLYGNISERVIPVDCYELIARHFAKWGGKQKEQPKEFTHHEVNESLIDAVTHQMEDDGNVDDFVRRGIDDIALKYAELGAKWQKEKKPAEWKPQSESLEALMYAIEGKWEMIKPTSYLSRRLEDLYEGLINTYNVDETFLVELPKTAYTPKDIEELMALKDKIDASMDEKPVAHENDFVSKPANATQTDANKNANAEWSEEYREEDLRTRFAFCTYKDEDGVLYLSNVFVEKTSRNKGFGTKILAAAEEVAKTIGAISIRLKVKQNTPANAWYRNHGYGYMTFEDGYDWLEKTLEYLKPVKQEWSEKDKRMLNVAIRSCEQTIEDYPNDKVRFNDCISWLKSLHPQPHWKPSEKE